MTRGVREAGLPVIWIRQELEADLSEAPLDQRDRNLRMLIAGTSGCTLLLELACSSSDLVVVKKRYSAFFGTDLDRMLASLRPELLIVCGINTHEIRYVARTQSTITREDEGAVSRLPETYR